MGLHMVCGKALEVKAYTQGGARVKAALYSETDLSNFLFRVGQLLPLGYTLPTQTLVIFLSTSSTGLYGSVAPKIPLCNLYFGRIQKSKTKRRSERQTKNTFYNGIAPEKNYSLKAGIALTALRSNGCGVSGRLKCSG